MYHWHRALWASAMQIKIYKPAAFWFLTALVVRLTLCLGAHYFSISIGRGGFFPLESGADDRFYWQASLALLSGHSVPNLPNPYPYFLAFLFRLTGPSLLMVKLANVILGAVAVSAGVLIAREVSSSRYSFRSLRHPANLTGLFLSLYPALAFYSGQLLKDTLVVFFGILSLLFYVKALRKGGVRLWLGGGLCTLALYAFRPYAAFALLFGLGIYLFVNWKIRLPYKLLTLATFLFIAAFVPYFEGHGLFGIQYIRKFASLEYIAEIREKLYSHGGSAVGISFQSGNLVEFIGSYFYSFLTAAFGPLPWQLKGMNVLIALPEAMLMWLLVPIWLKGILSTRSGPEKLLIYLSWILLGVIALFSDNIGADVRLRLLPWSSFLIFAGVYLGRK